MPGGKSQSKHFNQETAMKIVCPNKGPDKDLFPWLLRDHKERPEQASRFKHISATNVTFKASEAYQEGFGNRVVAYCEQAVGSTSSFALPSKRRKKLTFNGVYFITSDHTMVTDAEEVEFFYDNRICAVV
jgi:hypothetical protein